MSDKIILAINKAEEAINTANMEGDYLPLSKAAGELIQLSTRSSDNNKFIMVPILVVGQYLAKNPEYIRQAMDVATFVALSPPERHHHSGLYSPLDYTDWEDYTKWRKRGQPDDLRWQGALLWRECLETLPKYEMFLAVTATLNDAPQDSFLLMTARQKFFEMLPERGYIEPDQPGTSVASSEFVKKYHLG